LYANVHSSFAPYSPSVSTHTSPEDPTVNRQYWPPVRMLHPDAGMATDAFVAFAAVLFDVLAALPLDAFAEAFNAE
jgi:hypothetical protein